MSTVFFSEVISLAKKVQDKVKTQRQGKTIVVAFGRFQPPTAGHQLLVDKVMATAKANGAEHAMFSSRSEDAEKNPLPPQQKFKWLKRFFPDANFINNSKIKNPVDMLYYLADKKYDHVIFVTGDDRVNSYESFKKLTKKSTERLKLKSISVVSAGKRDPKAKGTAGISGTQLRNAVKEGKFNVFRSVLPRGVNGADSKQLFNDVKKGLTKSIKEELNFSSIYSAAATRILESDKYKRRAPTPGQKGGFSKHNKIFPIPPCKIDEGMMYWFENKWKN